jgi:uncharacterized protein (DUF1697 family)
VYVALLRGINVGSHKRVTMADLRAVLVRAGYPDVTTYIQTGNVLLTSDEGSGPALGDSLERALARGLELEADVIVRSAAELAQVVRANPFLERGADPSTLYVGFLKAAPEADAAQALEKTDFRDERFELRGADLYLQYPAGLGRSKMSAAFFERTLRVRLTVRRWSVVVKLLELAEGLAVAP